MPVSKGVTLEARGSLSRERASWWIGLALSAAVALAVGVPAASNGAYFPTSWGWAALVFSWVAALALVVRQGLVLSRLEVATLAALVAFVGWTALSIAWSTDVTQSVLEVERALVYVTALLAVLAIVRPRHVTQLLGGVLAAITVVATYALATRLFPDRIGSIDQLALNRLARPLGYWNALGLFTAMGCLLALVFAARARALWGRALAAAAIPALTATLYFTFGRGAWIALGAGLLATVAIDARRLQLVSTLLVVAPASVASVWIASRSDALTSRAPALADATREGHRFAPIVVSLAVLAALCVLLLAYVERRLPLLPRARLAYGAALWLIALCGLLAIFAQYGNPWSIARKGYDQFTRPPVSTAGTPTTHGSSLNRRLLSFWGNGRADFWKAAWRDSRAHPWLGSGAGTYEQYWLQHRSIPGKVRDAHSLYMETLAELGPLGLVLLVAALGLPLVAAFRIRRRRLAAGAFGAYVAYLVHAAADWDWEVTAVTLTALFCGAALLIAARDEESTHAVRLQLRTLLVALALAAGALSLIGLISNSALSASNRAALSENWPKAEAQARKAIRWAPWSSAGREALGEAQLQQGKLAEARASFREAIAKNRRDWNLWLDLALASKGRARREAAIVALGLNPLSPEIAGIRRTLLLGGR